MERTIALFSFILQIIQTKDDRDAGRPYCESRTLQPSVDEDGHIIWKPGVYWVTFLFLIMGAVILLAASFMWDFFENESDWNWFDSFYYAFVAFATIGFGDYISGQQPIDSYPTEGWYYVGNIMMLILGAAILYSVFNIVAIVMMKWLNKGLRLVSFIDPLPVNKPVPMKPKTSPRHEPEHNDPPKINTYDANGTWLERGAVNNTQHRINLISNNSTLPPPSADPNNRATTGKKPSLSRQATKKSLDPREIGPMAIATQKLADDAYH